ncbi:Uncharacterised protein [Legionella gratiana]|uniref:Uncharacterized protein n=1 Tax=Legionella gratiana TaxID=45066 RepID=A0A378JE08_9GAMM|nr:Uncharacterised protein [Legionella gratiana]
MLYILNLISPNNHFKRRLITLINDHKINPVLMGFPLDWKDRNIWN